MVRRGRSRRGGREWRRHLAVVLLLAGASVALQFSTPTLGSVDGYFHARYAALIRVAGVRGFPPAFPWLPLTIRSAERYSDHHMLFHVLLAPFTAGDVVNGTKWASAIFGAAAFAAVYLSLVRLRVRRALWWLLALGALAPDFLYRMEMPRVQALSLVVLLTALNLALARRFAWLLPVAAVYTWLYDAFPLLLVIAGVMVVAIAFCERRAEWRPLTYSSAGIAIGLLVNPYLPNNLWFIAQHYLSKREISETVHVGTEWYPYPVAQWLGWGGAIAVLATAAWVAWRGRARLDTNRLTLLLVAAIFFVLMWRSRRFIEYAGPFILIALAAALHTWLEPQITRLALTTRRIGAGILVVACAGSAAFAISQLRGRPAPERYAAGAAWLTQHTSPAAIVLTPNWDDFPLLFFHNQRNRYVIGLDPAYLAQRDAELYRLWQQLGRGEVTPPSRVLDRFDADVVLSDRTHDRFLAALAADPAMERVYEDGDCVIYRRHGAVAVGQSGS
jgi:hypothetical protein